MTQKNDLSVVFRHELILCPICDSKIDAAGTVDGLSYSPKEGDVSLCAKCGGFLVYDEKCLPMLPPDDLFDSLPDETKRLITFMQMKIVEMRGGSVS